MKGSCDSFREFNAARLDIIANQQPAAHIIGVATRFRPAFHACDRRAVRRFQAPFAENVQYSGLYRPSLESVTAREASV